MKINKYILIFFAAVLVGSCESYTEDLNDDPNNFIVAASDLIIGQSQLALMQHMGSNNARYAGIFSNTMSGADRQYLTLNTYSPNRSNYDDMWGDTYLQGINTAQLIINDENAGDLVKGIAKIIQGTLYADMAALYGDVPFSQAVNPNEYPTPVYDPQADVVNGGIALIEQGIAQVGNTSISAGFGGNRLSGGTWAEAGHTLAARYSLLAGNYASAISHANQGISSRANDLVTQHGTSLENRNLFYQFIIDERQDYLKANEAHLVYLLDGTTSRKLTTPGQQAQYDFYFIPDLGGEVALNTNSNGKFGMTSPMTIASYHETQFILAESKFMQGDEAGARQHLNNVRFDLRVQYSSDATGFPDSVATGTDLHLQILEEKYITLMGELVTFHDLRRTRNAIGVPNKQGAIGASNFPQRYLYPQSELDTNPNIPASLPDFFDPTNLFTSY